MKLYIDIEFGFGLKWRG